MIRKRLSHVLAISAGLLVAAGAPGLALAHGYAHHEEHERASHEHRGPGPAVHDEAPAHDTDHAHAVIDPGSVPRVDLSWDVQVAPVGSQVAEEPRITATPLPRAPSHPPPRASHARAGTSRAPPHTA